MPLATYDDAMREFAANVGRNRQDCAWILTDYDVWVRNPFYNGPPNPPHPEDDCDNTPYDWPLNQSEFFRNEYPPIVDNSPEDYDIPF